MRASIAQGVIDIEGVKNEILDLAELLSSGEETPKTLALNSDSEFHRISVVPDSSLVTVNASKDQITIKGKQDCLAKFANSLLSLMSGELPPAGSKLRAHTHIEYYPGHFFLDPSSTPTIVTLC